MSKNSPKQNYEQVKAWANYMAQNTKRKRKKKKINPLAKLFRDTIYD